MKFTIPYPKTKKGKAFWNKTYGLNAIYAGKHWAKRVEDKNCWEELVLICLKQQKIPVKIFDNPVEIQFKWNDNMDIDNHAYMGKMIVDALKGYLLKDDNKKHYAEVTHKFHDKDFIEITITEVVSSKMETTTKED